MGMSDILHNPVLLITIVKRNPHGDAVVQKALEMIHPDQVIKVGGAGHKALLVLDGTADVYLFPTKGTKKWDTCAPEAVLVAAGGELTDKDGKKLRYFSNSEASNSNGIVASFRDHEKHIKQLSGLSML